MNISTMNPAVVVFLLGLVGRFVNLSAFLAIRGLAQLAIVAIVLGFLVLFFVEGWAGTRRIPS